MEINARLSLPICVFLLVVHAATGAPDLKTATPSLSLEITSGCVTRLGNRLTDETIVTGANLSEALPTQLIGIGQMLVGGENVDQVFTARPDPTTASMHLPKPGMRPEIKQDNAVMYRDLQAGKVPFPGESFALSTRCDPVRGNDLLLAASGDLKTGAAGCVAFGIVGIPDSIKVITPAVGGQCFSAKTPDFKKTYQYAFSWDSPLVILQGAKGGVSIWCDDPQWSEKQLVVEHAKGMFNLTFVTLRNEGPVKPSLVSPDWHFTAYQGNWTVPAKQYRDMMVSRWGLKTLWEGPPSWVKDIRVLIPGGFDKKTVDAICGLLDPKTVLLYDMVETRTSPPDAVTSLHNPDPKYANDLAYARGKGLHVIEFCYYNMLAMDGNRAHKSHFYCPKERPDCGCIKMGGPQKMYDMFLPYTYDRYGHGKGDVMKCIYGFVHPALKAGRDMVMNVLQQRIEKYHVDGFYMDTTGVPRYHPKGPVEGKNDIQGEIAYWQELRQRFPDCAFMSEAITETTPVGARIGYRSHSVHGLNNEREVEIFRQSLHPLSAYLFSSFTWGYLQTFSSPDSNPKHQDILVNESIGCIPTLDYLSSVDNPDQFILKYCQIYSEQQLQRYFPDNWDQNVISYYKNKRGHIVKYEVTPSGDRMVEADGNKEQVLLGRVHGVAEAAPPSGLNLIGWPAWSGDKAIGLMPERYYPYLPIKRDARWTINHLPEDAAITKALDGEAYSLVSFAGRSGNDSSGKLSLTTEAKPTGILWSNPESVSSEGNVVSATLGLPNTLVLFWKPTTPITAANGDLTLVPRYPHNLGHDGFEKPLIWPVSYGVSTGDIKGVKKKAIFARPAYGEFTIDWMLELPAKPSQLKFSLGTVGVEPIKYRVRVNDKTVFEEDQNGPATAWGERQVDLSPWAGKAVLLSLVTSPFKSERGPERVYWGEPAIVSK